MSDFSYLRGVYAAALTPLKNDYSPDLNAIPLLLDFLAQRGCHGALLLGTTGEGPSFSPSERLAILKAALQVRQAHPEFHLLAGTGTPSLDESIGLTKAAFDLGLDGVVVLPPYYYRRASEEGLFRWFSQLIKRSVPRGGACMGYHIPAISGVPLPLTLLERLKGSYPDHFAGIKDSSGSMEHARQLASQFGPDLLTLVGNDRLISSALELGLGGCITALANLCSPDLRTIWDTHLAGQVDPSAQRRLNAAREIMDKYPPAPPLLKALLAQMHPFPLWAVRPPLIRLPQDKTLQLTAEFNTVRNV